MQTYKILHLIGGGEIGGAEQHVLTLLSNLNPSHFRPTVICLAKGPFAELLRQRGIECYTLPMKFPLDIIPLPDLIKIIRSNQISLIHTHGSRGNLLGRLAARFTGIPCLTTVHSSLRYDYLSRLQAWIALLIDRMTLPLATGVIAVSSFLARELIGKGALNVRTIYNGHAPISIPDPQKNRTDFRTRWKIPLDSVVVGTIARLHPTKGLEYLVAAAKLLQTRVPNLHLLIIGDGPLNSELQGTLSSTNIPYTLTGFIPQAYEALPAMDVFTLPSISEGMGLVLLEAMQAGIPVVASKVGGIPEVVRSDIDGLLVPPANPEQLAEGCLRLIEDHSLAERLVTSASERWQEFSIENMVKRTEDFYLSILQK